MTAAPWLAPLGDGVTIAHITDTHVNMPRTDDSPGITNPWWEDRLREIADDWNTSPFLRGIVSRVHTGDIVDDATDDEFTWAKNWLTTNMGGASDVWVQGNHDYGNGEADPLRTRTRAYLEATYGRSVLSSAYATGQDGTKVRIIGFAPDQWTPANKSASVWPMTAATISWIDSQMQADQNTPTFFACHYPFQELATFPDGTQMQPQADFVDLVATYKNIVGHLSGHYHREVTNAYVAVDLAVGGRTLAHINGPSATITGGYGPGIVNPFHTLLVTYRGPAYTGTGRVEVRYRSHGARQLVVGRDGKHITVLHPA